MDISGLITQLIQAEAESPVKAHQRLRVGDVLRLRVLEAISGDRFRIDLGRFRAVAQIQFPVAPGDELNVEVEAAGRQFRLRVSPAKAAHPPGRTAGAPNSCFPAGRAEPLRQALTRYITRAEGGGAGAGLPDRVINALRAVAVHLEPLHPQGDTGLLADRLKERVEASGLFFEKKLEAVVSSLSPDREKAPARTLQLARQMVGEDFKAQLLVLKRFLDKSSNLPDRAAAESARQLNRAVTGMLGDIHAQQAGARQADPHQLFHIVMYDLHFQDNRRKGRLKMYFPRKGRGRDRNGFRLSLLLHLDRLGDLRSDIVLRGKDLAVTFFTAAERTRAQLENRLEIVAKALRAHFARVSVSVILAEKKVSEFESDPVQADGDRTIDMRV